MQRSLHDAWWRLTTNEPRSPFDRLARGVLRVGAGLYGAAVASRNAGYDRACPAPVRLPYPVISVGNLSVGGTGKTPCVEWVASALTAAGRRVGVLSRGYGGRSRAPYAIRHVGGRLLVDEAPCEHPEELPDEPQLLAAHLPETPIVVGAKRAQTGQLACERFGATALVLDDGFQHRQLARDCDIVLVSARMPLSGWPLLPAGPMREPLSSLRRAHIVIITRADQSLEMVGALREGLRQWNESVAVATAMHEPVGVRDLATGATLPLTKLEGARVLLVSSIGDPDGFEQTAKSVGAAVAGHRIFPDHHRYGAEDWAQLAGPAAGAQAILTTEKDAVRLHRVAPADPARPVWVLNIRLKFLSGEEGVHARIRAVFVR